MFVLENRPMTDWQNRTNEIKGVMRTLRGDAPEAMKAAPVLRARVSGDRALAASVPAAAGTAGTEVIAPSAFDLRQCRDSRNHIQHRECL